MVYSELGFGPAYPWGVLDRAPTLSMGSDDMWYLSLEDAVRASGIWKAPDPPVTKWGELLLAGSGYPALNALPPTWAWPPRAAIIPP